MKQLFDDRRQLIAEQAAAAQGRATSPAVAMDDINKVNDQCQLIESAPMICNYQIPMNTDGHRFMRSFYLRFHVYAIKFWHFK